MKDILCLLLLVAVAWTVLDTVSSRGINAQRVKRQYYGYGGYGYGYGGGCGCPTYAPCNCSGGYYGGYGGCGGYGGYGGYGY